MAAHGRGRTSAYVPTLAHAVSAGRDVASAETLAAGEASFCVRTIGMKEGFSCLTLGRRKLRNPGFRHLWTIVFLYFLPFWRPDVTAKNICFWAIAQGLIR
jgi:hypothetical protein